MSVARKEANRTHVEPGVKRGGTRPGERWEGILRVVCKSNGSTLSGEGDRCHVAKLRTQRFAPAREAGEGVGGSVQRAAGGRLGCEWSCSLYSLVLQNTLARTSLSGPLTALRGECAVRRNRHGGP